MAYNPEVSHRGYNIECKWYQRIKNSFDIEKNPVGIFYAKEMTEKEATRDYFGNNSMVLIERDNILIKTPDNLDGIKIDDVIDFDGERWFVSSFKRKRVRAQQLEFTHRDKINYFWMLNLRK